MSWWKTALYDTCSLITLDKLLLERPSLVRHFPSSILALEESFSPDQLREETARRMRARVTICPLPPTADLAAVLAVANLSKALAVADTLVFATAVHSRLAVVTGDQRLAKAGRATGLPVGNMAVVLRELVVSRRLTTKGCAKLLLGLASRKDYLLGVPTPTWEDLQGLSFPD